MVHLNYTSGVPIYVQLKESIKHAIMTGAYPQGAQLPTVRQMAVELKINANTVSRAYMELERERVISSQQGRGTFVNLPHELDLEKLAQLESKVLMLLEDAKLLGFSSEHVVSMILNASETV